MSHTRLAICVFLSISLAIGMWLVSCTPAPVDITPTATLFIPPTLPSPTKMLDAPILGSISTPTSNAVTPQPSFMTATPLAIATISSGTIEPSAGVTRVNTRTPGPTTECVLNAVFLEDITIPDDTVLEPGEAFIKTWRVENAGNCNWGKDIVLVFLWGTLMAEKDRLSVPSTTIDSTADISVEMTAPTEPGVHVAMWQIQTADGQQVGTQLYLRIVVQTD
ncbi:MAG: hypothetical protein JXB07_08200 [Anaerolineae bacterium]|nr:hypothetical protein [Anaerolineae bacterium]